MFSLHLKLPNLSVFGVTGGGGGGGGEWFCLTILLGLPSYFSLATGLLLMDFQYIYKGNNITQSS